MKVFKSLLPVAAAGLVCGAAASRGLRFSVPAVFQMAIAMMALLLVWPVVSCLLGVISNISFRKSLELAALPLAAVAILPALFYPVARSPDYFISVFLASAGLAAALLSLRFPVLRKGLLNTAAGHTKVALAVIIVVWIAAASTMDVSKALFLNGASNIAMFTEMLKNVSSEQGTLFSNLFYVNGSSVLGVHANFVWYFIYPFFRLWPTAEWLLILSNIVLGLAAVPVYLMARRFFSPGVGLLLALAFLASRFIIQNPASGEITEERFLPLLLIFAVYFWLEKRFLPFAVFSLLTLTVREDAGIVIALLGVVSLFKRMDLKWWLPPMIAGTAWFVVMVKWFIPAMNPMGEASRTLVIYGGFGDSVGEILRNVLFDPRRVFDTVFSNSNHKLTVYYLWELLGFGIPLISGAALIALPSVAETLLSRNASPGHFNTLAIAAATFPALILGLAKIDRLAKKRGYPVLTTGIVLVMLFANVAVAYNWFQPRLFKPRPNYAAAMRVVDLIPEDASVIMPRYLLLMAKPAQKANGYNQVAYEVSWTGGLHIEQDYVVLDLATRSSDARYQYGFDTLRDEVQTSADFALVFDDDDLQVYRRKTPVKPSLANALKIKNAAAFNGW